MQRKGQTIELDTRRFRIFETIVYYDLILALGCMLSCCVQQYATIKSGGRDMATTLDEAASALDITLAAIYSRMPSNRKVVDEILADAYARDKSQAQAPYPLWDEYILQIFGLAWVTKHFRSDSIPITDNADGRNGAIFLFNLLFNKHVSWFSGFDLECMLWSGLILSKYHPNGGLAFLAHVDKLERKWMAQTWSTLGSTRPEAKRTFEHFLRVLNEADSVLRLQDLWQRPVFKESVTGLFSKMKRTVFSSGRLSNISTYADARFT